MSDPTLSQTFPPPPQQGSPFAPDRVRTPTGCGRLALVGCGVATLLLGVAAVVFLFKANDLLGWTLKQIEAQLASRLPAELSVDERARLASAFTGAREAVESGKLDPRALQLLQARLQHLSGLSSAPVSRDEILSLVGSLEAVAAGAGEKTPPTASPTPATSSP